MYPFKRYLGKLKKTVRNKARVEGSIANAYLVEECSNFCSYYFDDCISTCQRATPRNHDGSNNHIEEDDAEMLDVFKYPGHPFGQKKSIFLTTDEYAAVHLYVLHNCDLVAGPIMSSFVDEVRRTSPRISEVEIEKALAKDFPQWFKRYVLNPNNNVSNNLWALAHGPLQKVKVYSGFFANGFKFNTLEHGFTRSANNSGVCIKGSCYTAEELDFYGLLLEVLEVEYPGVDPIKRIVLFNYEWFDPSLAGTYVHPQFKLVSVNHTRRINMNHLS